MENLDETRKALFDKLENLAPRQKATDNKMHRNSMWLLLGVVGLGAIILAGMLFSTGRVSQQEGLFNTMVDGQNNRVDVVNGVTTRPNAHSPQTHNHAKTDDL